MPTNLDELHVQKLVVDGEEVTGSGAAGVKIPVIAAAKLSGDVAKDQQQIAKKLNELIAGLKQAGIMENGS